MNEHAWLQANNDYLAESLKWLRLRLGRLAPDDSGQTLSLEPYNARTSPGFFRRVFRGEPSPREDLPRLTQEETPPLDYQLEQATASRAATASIEPTPALLMLADRLDLSHFERDTLLLCAAMELDPGIGQLCARAQGHTACTYPTFELALSLFDDPSWDALSPSRPLRYARLIEIKRAGDRPLIGSPLQADERIVGFLKGLSVMDERLSSLMRPVNPGVAPLLSATQQSVTDDILEQLKYSAAETQLPVTQLVGADSGSKTAVAQQVCAALDRHLYVIDGDTVPARIEEVETLSRLWQRESLLLPVALYVDAEDLDEGRRDSLNGLHRFLSHEVGLIFVGARESPLKLACPNAAFDVAKPTAGEQYDAWQACLGAAVDDPALGGTARALAGQYDLNLSEIRDVHKAATASPGDLATLGERLWDGCRDITRPRLDLLAHWLEPKATWDDIVLANEPMNLLRQITGQVRERHKVYDDWGFSGKMNRGFGISALFAGESGTGKTMAAEVIANDLKLNLYRIDLSAVVSKYIGETEKNLRKLFDAAEQGGAILFFDEADALFGKRSEVKDSHDRYANIEINYLLQRMETFRGLAILATNMRAALDPAFTRRLRFIVNFRFPGVQERQRIWEKALPPQVPRQILDYERLARLNVSGGNIHNIALQAAFLAAQDGETVTMPIILSAARTELRKLEKPFNEAQLR
jgi:hypothetical protein